MIATAVVLLLIVAVFTVAVVVNNPGVVDLSIFGAHLPVTAAGVYFNGAGAMLVLVVSLSLLRRGLRRELRRRRQVRSLRTAVSGATRDPVPQGGQLSPQGVAVQPTGDQRPPMPVDSVTASSGVSGREAATPGQRHVHPPTVHGSVERRSLLDEVDELTGDGKDR